MLDFHINILPFIVILVVNFFFSWIWYSPLLFAKPWAKALGIDMGREMTEEDKKKMPFLFLGGLVASALLSYGLQILIHSLKINSFGDGALFGLIAWLSFAVTHSLNTAWEGRKLIVLVINNGLFALSYIVFSGVIAIWN